MMVSIASSLAVRLCRGCMYTPPRGAANASSSFSWLHRKPQTCSFFRATIAAFASRKDIEGKLKQAIEVRVRKKLLPSHGNGSIAITHDSRKVVSGAETQCRRRTTPKQRGSAMN